jgi:hypothetical protein
MHSFRRFRILSRALLPATVTLTLAFALHGYLTRQPRLWGPTQISPDGRFELVMLAQPSVVPTSLAEFFGRPAVNPDGYLVLRYHDTHQEIRRGFRQALASRLPPWGPPHWGKNYMAIECDDDPFWPLPK